jgi:DUF4097 and DUF4098 domain-containing protein YvlB
MQSVNRPRMFVGAGFALALLVVPVTAMAATRIEKQLALEPGGTFRLDADSGSVQVVGGDGTAVEIVLTSKRDDLEERYDMSFESTGTEATVRLERRKGLAKRWFTVNDSIRFEVHVPRAVDVFVDTAGGRIELEAIDGTVDLDTSGGRIDVERVRGDVVADTSGGGIEVSDVEGSVRADTSGGAINISEVTGDIVADTSGGRIDIEGAGGSVRADTSGGTVRVVFAAGNDRGGSLETSGGGVTAVIDPSVGLEIDASSSGGGVQTDLPLTVQGSWSRTRLEGTLNGGGASLRLRSSGGGVRIESL